MERYGSFIRGQSPRWFGVQGVRYANSEALAIKAAKEMWHDSRDFEIIGIETEDGKFWKV